MSRWTFCSVVSSMFCVVACLCLVHESFMFVWPHHKHHRHPTSRNSIGSACSSPSLSPELMRCPTKIALTLWPLFGGKWRMSSRVLPSNAATMVLEWYKSPHITWHVVFRVAAVATLKGLLSRQLAALWPRVRASALNLKSWLV